MPDPRKLAAILAADAAGYARLMGDDEQATVRTLTEYRQVFSEHIAHHKGRVVDTAGDSVLAIFDSPVEAVECSVEIQRELAKRNHQLADHRRMQFRMGLTLGDVIARDDGTIYGDGVNIAARLQTMAEPGGICISASVHEQVEGRLPVEYISAGEQLVKNIAKPVKVYKLIDPAGLAAHRPALKAAQPVSGRTLGAAVLLVLIVAVAAGAWWWHERTARITGPAATSHAASDKPSIAVLPFTNLSGDASQEYLSDGITEDIITALSRFSKLSVVARNSTFVYKGKPVDVRQVGKDLGVRYVLEGSVRRGQDRVRVTAQLIDVSDGKHIWAENYDRDLKDVLGVQDEVTQQIVGRLDVEVDRAQLEQARRTSPKDFRAYDLALQARKLIYDHSEANHRVSRDLLERAVTMDDQLAQAHIELAWIYLDEYRFKWNPRPDPLERALKAALRGVELEPNNGFAHWRLAKIHFFRKELEQFEIEKARALTLNPNHAETLGDVAIHLAVLDRTDEAFEYAQKAIKLDPQLTWVYFAYAEYYYRKQRYREALTAAHQINIPAFYWTRFWRAVSYAQLGELESARREAAEVLRLKPDFAYRPECAVWNCAQTMMAHVSEGARKAGIPVIAGDRATASTR